MIDSQGLVLSKRGARIKEAQRVGEQPERAQGHVELGRAGVLVSMPSRREMTPTNAIIDNCVGDCDA